MIMKHPLTTSVNLLQAWLYYIVLHSITRFIIKFLSLKLVCFLTWPFGETLLFFCSKRFRFLHHCLNCRFVQWNSWSFQHNQNSYSIKTTENANETFCRVTMDTILFTQLLVGTWCMEACNVKWTFYPVIILIASLLWSLRHNAVDLNNAYATYITYLILLLILPIRPNLWVMFHLRTTPLLR